MPAATHRYSETLRVPWLWWPLGAGFAVVVWWVFFVATPPLVALVAGTAALLLVTAGLIRYGAARVTVDDDGLRAGRAFLTWPYVGTADALDADQTRLALGVDADARAFLLVRSYCRHSVRVEVDDEADPTPYWLVSTRHAHDLAAHVNVRTVQD